jgi:hypothetical protein
MDQGQLGQGVKVFDVGNFPEVGQKKIGFYFYYRILIAQRDSTHA